MHDASQKFVEKMGLLFEADGMPRIAGRVLGLLMLVAGISVLARAIRARHRRAIAASAAGLAAIIAAAFGGAAFVSNGQAGASMAMAVLTGVALLCYLANLLMVSPAVSPAAGNSPGPEHSPAAGAGPAAATKE